MKKKSKKDTESPAIMGSGNVYRDLGFSDADDRLAKAEIASKIYTILQQSGMSQAQVAQKLETDPSRISNLMRGRLKEFSMDRLFQFLNKLDRDVEVRIRPKRQEQASFHVIACA